MPVFQPMRTDFSRALNWLRVISMNSDWFIALFVLVVIGQNKHLSVGFSLVGITYKS